MPFDPSDPDPSVPAFPESPLDPVRERERILARVRGKTLDAQQAEWLCATLTLLAEMEPGGDHPGGQLLDTQ